MKKLAKLAALILSLAVLLSACSGSNSTSGSAVEEKPLSELMAQITDGATGEIATADMEINDENFKSFLFIDPIDGAEALASEAQISAVAHSVVLLRVPEGTDAAAVARDIEKAADPRKWLCVEAEKTEVVQHGRLILLVMSFSENTDKIVENFNALF